MPLKTGFTVFLTLCLPMSFADDLCKQFGLRNVGPDLNPNCLILLGLLGVSKYSDIYRSDKKIEYEYSSMPKSLDRDLFLTTEMSSFLVQANVLQSEFKE